MEKIIKQILWFLGILPGRFWILGIADIIGIYITTIVSPLMKEHFSAFAAIFMMVLSLSVFNIYTFAVPKDEWLSPLIVKMKNHRREWLSRKP